MEPYSDAITRPFWDAATRHELIMQRCEVCGRFQHYPRVFCLACSSRNLTWEGVSGRGHVYSATTVQLKVVESQVPPYQLILVDLAEGVRILSKTLGEPCNIGDPVFVAWEDRGGDMPPLPVFVRNKEEVE